MSKTKNNNLLIYIIIFLAGFSFLIYEVSWNRYLSLILGTTVTASTIVLMAFMAGFGFGALILGKRANNTKNPQKLLSIILGGIAIMSLLNFFLIGKIIPTLYSFFSNNFTADILLFSLIFILLLFPAFFMGGVIPLANKILIIDNKNIEKKLGTIYATETLGSTMGGLFAGFVLLGLIGQQQTIFVAVAINLLIAIYIFTQKQTNDIASVNHFNNPLKSNFIENNSINNKKIAIIATFFMGFALLALQIIWLRAFKIYFTNTSYTFSLITAFVILGLSIGSWIYKKHGNKIKNDEIIILRSIILIVLFFISGLIILINIPELIMFPFNNLSENTIIRLFVIPVIASILIVLPASVVSGFTFPLVWKMYSGGIENISQNVGRVLMFNTIGSVIGPATATFVLIPLLGVAKSILIIALLMLGVTVFLTFLIKYKKISVYKNTLIGISLILLFFILFSNQIKIVPPSIKKFDKKIISYNETIEGTLIIVDEPNKGIFGKSTFVNNSSVIGSNYDAIKAVKMIGHLPFFANLKCEKVLIIGFGVGVTTSAIASHSEVKSIDCVELVPGLVKTANNYNEFNFEVYNDKRLNIIKGDGRHFLQTTTNKYDLISCDPTHPVLGSGNLYTKEYFEQCYKHLNNSGMVSQYLPLHKLRKEDLQGIIKTFNSVFPNSSVWVGQYHAILLGTKGEGKIDFAAWKTKANATPKDDFFYLNPYHIASSVVFDNQKIKGFSENIKINTDNKSYTEFFALSSFNSENLYENLKYLSENRCDPNDIFTNIDSQMKMDEFVSGNKKLMESLYFSLKGDKVNAQKKLKDACNVNPNNQEYPFLLKFYYGD